MLLPRRTPGRSYWPDFLNVDSSHFLIMPTLDVHKVGSVVAPAFHSGSDVVLLATPRGSDRAAAPHPFLLLLHVDVCVGFVRFV